MTLRDYEITQCVVRILGDGNLLWESAPLTNENNTVKPQRFYIHLSNVVALELVTEDIGKSGYAPYVVWIRPEFGKR
ncbi:MAG: NPCBM/NEW2 domain-containing protein [Terrimicrobiaceae bacterium]